MTMTEHKIPVAEPTPQWVTDTLKKARKEGITEIIIDGRTWNHVHHEGSINGWITEDVTPEERQQVFDDIKRRNLERWK